jgi:Mrp family chromosome partitioning ATPase/capsular polysaccharide biosynthesis protein
LVTARGAAFIQYCGRAMGVERETDLRAVLDVLWRRANVIGIALASAVLVAVFVGLLLPPRYTATALIQFDPQPSNVLGGREGFSRGNDSARVDGEVELLRSVEVIERVINTLALAELPQFQRFGAGAELMLEVRRAFSVQRQRLTFLIGVSATANDPATAKLLANGLAEAHIAISLEHKVDALLVGARLLHARLEEAAREVALEESQAEPSGDSDATEPDVTGFVQEQNLRVARAQYATLAMRVAEIEASAGAQLADSRIASYATEPIGASFPNWPLVLLIAGVCGLGTGVVAAFVIENFIGGFSSVEQLEQVSQCEVVTATPLRIAGRRPDGAIADSLADEMVFAPFSEFPDSVRRLRLRLEQVLRAQSDERGQLIVVASPVAQDGKTTLALALARKYAEDGRRVLLVDGNLRDAKLHKHLGLPPQPSLVHSVSSIDEDYDISPVLAKDPLSNVVVFLGPEQRGEAIDQILTGPRFMQLVTAARRTFDIVVLDTPAILERADGVYLAQLADAVVMLTRWSGAPQRVVMSALGQIRRTLSPETPILMVLSQVPVKEKKQRTALADAVVAE